MLQREFELSARTGTSLGLIMLDVDHFKQVNDRYGHLIGDLVLVDIASRMQQAVRSYDLVGRYGGEEFLVVSPDCDLTQVQMCAERIRESVAGKPVSADGALIEVTVSAGVAMLSSLFNTEREALAAADNALYRAKAAGRNRVTAAVASSAR